MYSAYVDRLSFRAMINFPFRNYKSTSLLLSFSIFLLINFFFFLLFVWGMFFFQVLFLPTLLFVLGKFFPGTRATQLVFVSLNVSTRKTFVVDVGANVSRRVTIYFLALGTTPNDINILLIKNIRRFVFK